MADELREILKRVEKLEKSVFGDHKKKPNVGNREIDFTLNERNFVKTYAKHMSGSKKFTLLVAYLAKGKQADVEGDKIVSLWNRMRSILGYSFNPKYTTEAKTNGWVDSKKRGYYFLRNNWKEILS